MTDEMSKALRLKSEIENRLDILREYAKSHPSAVKLSPLYRQYGGGGLPDITEKNASKVLRRYENLMRFKISTPEDIDRRISELKEASGMGDISNFEEKAALAYALAQKMAESGYYAYDPSDNIIRWAFKKVDDGITEDNIDLESDAIDFARYGSMLY